MPPTTFKYVNKFGLEYTLFVECPACNTGLPLYQPGEDDNTDPANPLYKHVCPVDATVYWWKQRYPRAEYLPLTMTISTSGPSAGTVTGIMADEQVPADTTDP